MKNNHIDHIGRRLASLVLAAAALTVLVTACGSHTDRPLTVRISVDFDYIGKRTDPQPTIDVFYRWDGGPGQLLMQRQAGSGNLSLMVQRSAIHGKTYTIEVWVVREDTGAQIGYASETIVVPLEGEPWSTSINLRGDTVQNPYDPILKL